MDLITHKHVAHYGTFNANPLALRATFVVLKDICTQENLASLYQMNENLGIKLTEIISKYDIPAHTSIVGAKGSITFSRKHVRDYRDYKATDFDIALSFWVWGLNRGLVLPPGLDEQWLVSVQHTQEQLQIYVDAFESFAIALTQE